MIFSFLHLILASTSNQDFALLKAPVGTNLQAFSAVVFQQANCTGEEITRLKQQQPIDPEKIEKIKTYAALLSKVLQELGAGASKTPGFTMARIMTQAIQEKDKREKMLLELQLLQMYDAARDALSGQPAS